MAIILDNITRGFKEHLVVNKLNLEINDGELFVLLGSSGSGKSTILRIIAGLLNQDEGKVFLNNEDVTNFSPQKRNIGFVFQNYAIFKNMTVEQNVEFGLKIRKIPRKERKIKTEMILDLVGLNGFNTRFPRELSGGQRQRVALARALVYEPKVLLLDEPFGALDAAIRQQLRKSLREIQQELKVTTVLVTHDQEEAFELGDRIGILEKGNLIEVGTPFDLYYKPKKEFVAKFLGGGNVVVGRCENDEIRVGNKKLQFPKDAPKHMQGAPVRILFRPEMVVQQEDEFKDNKFFPIGQGILKDYKFLGPINKLEFELDSFKGARPVMPALSYGQRYAKIACTEQSVDDNKNFSNIPKIGSTRYLALSSYHVLEPSALKFIMLVNDFDKKEGGVVVGKELALASSGTLSLLGVCTSIDKLDKTQKGLNKVKDFLGAKNNYHLDTCVRGGKPLKEFIREVQEGYYDLALIDAPREIEKKESKKLRTFIKNLLIQAGVPVLIVNEKTKDLSKFLICIKCGEPGKNVINFGARIARHIKSKALIYYSLLDESKKDEERVKKYLNNAEAVFDLYNLECKTQMEKGKFSKNLLTKVKSENPSIVFFGAPMQDSNEAFNLMHDIIYQTQSSVLVFPSLEQKI